MTIDSRVQPLLDELLETQSTPEAVCRECPELLPVVRERWQRLRRVRDRLDAMFPSLPDGSTDAQPTSPRPEASLPRIDGYEVEELIGRGGMGLVFRVRHLGLKRVVALKMAIAGAFAGPLERERFQREAETVARLRHPNIVQIHDVGDSDGRPYFTMEYVEGGNLARKLDGAPQPPREAAALVSTLAGAMHAAHLDGIIHRDLKPSNVLLTSGGVPKIGDFGLARRMDDDAGLTHTGAAIGTPSYMAPELAASRRYEVGTSADVYSLGAILYESLAGVPPFQGASSAETIHHVLNREVVPPSTLQPRVPRDLETICLKCLFKEPRLRYESALALREDLDRFLRGEAIAARPEGRAGRLARRIARRPVLSGSILGGSLLATAALGGMLWLIAERSATSRRIEAEQKATLKAADDDLKEMAALLRKSSWAGATAALGRAKARLNHLGSREIQARMARGARDLDLLARLDGVRMTGYSNGDGVLDFARSDVEYGRAFREAGIGEVGESPEIVAARIKASDVEGALLAALDYWSSCVTEPGRLRWVNDVAKRADGDRSGWRDRVRDPAAWKDRAALFRLIENAPFPEQSVPLLLAAELRSKDDAMLKIAFLRHLHLLHPDDFWVNFRLGNVLHSVKKSPEAVGYLQAAQALRPGVAIVHNNLGIALTGCARNEEAIDQFRKSIAIDPGIGASQFNLAVGLWNGGHHAEALEQFRVAIRLDSRSVRTFLYYGRCLDMEGRYEEALVQYRKALDVGPKDREALQELREFFVRQRRMEEARSAWARLLETGPTDHQAWYGYAELCLYLGLEEEYLGARRDLLARFGEVKDPIIAERTGRACLLKPASGEELRRIVALAARAGDLERSKVHSFFPFFQFVKGLSQYRQDDHAGAIATMRGDAAIALGPAPRLVVAMALQKSGQADEARKTLAEAVASYDWGPSNLGDQDGWIIHSLRREAETLIATEPNPLAK